MPVVLLAHLVLVDSVEMLAVLASLVQLDLG